MSGLIADAKTLIDKARVETQVSLLDGCLGVWIMLLFLTPGLCKPHSTFQLQG